MSTQPDAGKSQCSLLFFLATPAEEVGLEEAATARGLPFERIKKNESPWKEDYHWLGPVGDETIIAVRPARHHGRLVMGSIGLLGTAARALRFKVATGAQGIVQLGMAFGTDPRKQLAGGVLVSTSIIPYDNRDIRPASRNWLKGISDFADETRDAMIEANRPIACRNAAQFVLSALVNDAAG
jgi:nucleoside phosphorylase